MPTRKGRTLGNRNNPRANGKGIEENELNYNMYYGDETGETFLKIDIFENEKNNLQARICGLERRNKALIIVFVISVTVLLILLIGTLTFTIFHQINMDQSLEKLYKLEKDQRKIQRNQYRIQLREELEEDPIILTELSQSLQKSAETKIVLKGGDWYSKGNVFWNGKPVCDDGWDSNDATQAQVVCRSLGFKTVSICLSKPKYITFITLNSSG